MVSPPLELLAWVQEMFIIICVIIIVVVVVVVAVVVAAVVIRLELLLDTILLVLDAVDQGLKLLATGRYMYIYT